MYNNGEMILDLKTNYIGMYCDNQSIIKLVQNLVFHIQIKHIKIHHHFIQVRILEGEIQLDYINTNQQPTNILTKLVRHVKFDLH